MKQNGRMIKMTDGVSLKGVFQGLIPDQLSIISAKVTSVSPLKVVSLNDEKLQISSASLIVPNHMKKHTEKMSFTLNKQYNNIDVTVDNSLAVGDVVYLLYLKTKSKFFVLGRGD